MSKLVKRASLKKPAPGDFPNLLEYLEASGQVQKLSEARLLKVRHLYVTKGYSTARIAKKLGIPEANVHRWVIAFSWEEERDRRLFSRLRNVKDFRDNKSEYLDERHDRILGTAETIAEQILNKHIDKQIELDPSELKAVVDTVKNSVAMRREIHGKEGKVSVSKRTISLEAPGIMKQIAAAVADSAPEQVKPATTKLLGSSPSGSKLGIKTTQDEEFDTLGAGDADTE